MEKSLSLGTTRVLRALQYFDLSSARNRYREYSLEVLYCGDCLYSKCFVFRYCGYIFTCALGVRYCSYSHYSQCLGLLSTRTILAASTPILSVLGLRFVLEQLSVKPSYVTLSTKKKIFWRDIPGMLYQVCVISYSAGHKVIPGIAQPRPHATFLYSRLRRIH